MTNPLLIELRLPPEIPPKVGQEIVLRGVVLEVELLKVGRHEALIQVEELDLTRPLRIDE